ncbi:hypothetical protein H2199_005708 [Coniosporium tulheliwenetii]|uniref:Uncharacterized protein n=1 Tax=Coniosporium tulheliwenetii TaxID=3383036 RepID=A0ACC2Z0H7_9PEZI|nr:hypothetical protein H2199_005708 [Cladosporium sp. JES 115]
MSAQPNPRAWVWTNNGNFHLCHDRDLFKTYDVIEPLPLLSLIGAGEILAKGIGSVDLDVQKSNGSRGVLNLTNGGVTGFTFPPGKATADDGQEVAWFPLDSGLWCLKLADGDDRLFPSSLREQDKPALAISTFAKSEPVRKLKMSKYQFLKEGWGSRENFQHSYGLKMIPDDFEQGDNILEGMMRDEAVA